MTAGLLIESAQRRGLMLVSGTLPSPSHAESIRAGIVLGYTVYCGLPEDVGLPPIIVRFFLKLLRAEFIPPPPGILQSS
jgi:hypothetical protein